MTKERLIQRLGWYYPTERAHAFLTFPVILLVILYYHPFRNVVLLTYGMVVCIVVLYQGQHYWKLRLHRLKGLPVAQDQALRFFRRSKGWNVMLILCMVPIMIAELYLDRRKPCFQEMFLWGALTNLFAILEHVNYYHVQLMVDNMYDVRIFTGTRA
ncbi:MAG: hypothetical protein KDB88_12280 [Flavobacteriales bacterium]|nr:hypothetical protein [Flavobacteriales bacterium]